MVVLLLLASALACSSIEERQRAAREEFEAAVAAKDVPTALAAIEDLRGALPEAPESTLEVARSLGRVGELNRAQWLLEEAARRHPQRKDVKLGLAEVSLLIGDAARALAAVAPIAADDPEYSHAMMLRARGQRDLGDFDASMATLEQAETLFPDWPRFRIERIEGFAEEKRFADALELIQQARSRDDLPEPQRPWFALSETAMLSALGEKAAALAVLEQLTGEDTGNEEAWRRRVAILGEMQRLDEAPVLLTEALAARPDTGFLYELLVSAEAARGNLAAAEAALRQRVERAPDARAVEQLAQHLYITGRPAEAAELLADADERFPGPESAELEYLHVAMLLNAGDTAAARRPFEVFERRHWSDPRAEYLRARFELADGDVAAAVERLKRLAPRFDRSDIHHWLAVALAASGDDTGAEFRFGIAIARNPQQVPSYLGLLEMLARRGAWERLLYHSLRLLALQPRNVVGLNAMVRALMARDNFREAEVRLRAYTERFPDMLAPKVALSVALRRQGRPEESLALLDAAAERFASEPEWLAERAVVLGLLGRYADGLASLEIPPGAADRASLHRARAYLLLESGNGPEGLAEVERALALDPAEVGPLRLSGDYLSSRGDVVAAARAYERYLTVRPADAETLFRLGVVRGRAGDSTGAIEAYRGAVALDEAAVAPRNNLAQELAQAGELKQALLAAQAAYARADSDAVVLDTLGWLYLRAERVNRAVALLERARRIAPEMPTARYHLAMAYRASGRTGEARELLDDLNENLEPGHELHARVVEALATPP
jgi:tetratricopeptide (TPR) repeat protein